MWLACSCLFGLGSDCRGLKTYLNWFYWMDVTGSPVHVEGQSTKDKQTSRRQGRGCFLSPVISPLLLVFACWLPLFSLPPPLLSSHCASQLALAGRALWSAGFSMTAPFRFPASSQCALGVCPWVLGGKPSAGPVSLGGHSWSSQPRSGLSRGSWGPVLSRGWGWTRFSRKDAVTGMCSTTSLPIFSFDTFLFLLWVHRSPLHMKAGFVFCLMGVFLSSCHFNFSWCFCHVITSCVLLP